MSRGTKRERLFAHVEHLRKAFVTPYPVTVFFAGQKRTAQIAEHFDPHWRIRGVTYRSGRRIYIVLNHAFPRWSMHDTLNHEWAHAMDWRPESVERMRLTAPFKDEKAAAQYNHEQFHDDHFYLDLGRIERAWESWEV